MMFLGGGMIEMSSSGASGGEGGRVTGGLCRPLSRPGPQGMREVLEKDSGQVGWCSQVGWPTLVKWPWMQNQTGGGVGSWETLQRADEQVPRPPGTGGTLPWPGPGSAPWGRSGSAAGRTGAS